MLTTLWLYLDLTAEVLDLTILYAPACPAGIVQLINNAPKVTDPRVMQLLDKEELALYQSTTKPSKLCGTMLSALTSNAGFEIEREVYINQMLGQVAANIAQVARIKLQSMPFGERQQSSTATVTT